LIVLVYFLPPLKISSQNSVDERGLLFVSFGRITAGAAFYPSFQFKGLVFQQQQQEDM
jgi:hypothetical protein